MTTARAILAGHLAEALPEGWTIHESATSPDLVTRPTVIIARREVSPVAEAPTTRRRHEVDIHLLTPTESTAVEDELDALLDTLLAAIEPLAGTVWWTRATRAVLDERWHAWRVTTVVHTTTEPDPTPEEPIP